jgi:hypothetical protein
MSKTINDVMQDLHVGKKDLYNISYSIDAYIEKLRNQLLYGYGASNVKQGIANKITELEELKKTVSNLTKL